MKTGKKVVYIAGLMGFMSLVFTALCMQNHPPVFADEIVSDVDDGGDAVVPADAKTEDGSGQTEQAGNLIGDLSGLFDDTGESEVLREGEALEDARAKDDPLYGYGDGGSTVNMGHLYVINGVQVRNSDFPSEHNECWAYANNVYAKIWGHNFWSEFNDTENMLRNLPDEELTLTPEHLKAYVSAAPAGSALRVCNEDYLHGNDIGGHSQIIISHDENGFTVFEGGLSAWPHRREAYYTWTGYCYSGWPGKYQYIKYIKWPGAGTWSEGAVGQNATDLGVFEEDQQQPALKKALKKALTDLAGLIGRVLTGEADPGEIEEMKELTAALGKSAEA